MELFSGVVAYIDITTTYGDDAGYRNHSNMHKFPLQTLKPQRAVSIIYALLTVKALCAVPSADLDKAMELRWGESIPSAQAVKTYFQLSIRPLLDLCCI